MNAAGVSKVRQSVIQNQIKTEKKDMKERENMDRKKRSERKKWRN